MDSTILIPLLFPVEPAFENLHDGNLIRVARPNGEHIGVLHVTHQPKTNQFGVVVQFGPASVTGDSASDTGSDQSFVATGHCGLPVHRVTLEELRRIKRTDDPRVPFALDARQS